MASDPTVCCILLTKDRPELAARAVRCFRAQTYANKWLYVINTGGQSDCDGWSGDENIVAAFCPDARGWPIGRLRNEAVKSTDHFHGINADIIIHWDDDDYSHQNRIAEQVTFLQSSGAAVVGYNQMLFWNTYGQRIEIPDPEDLTKTMWVNSFDNRGYAESWLYTGPAHQPLGTSLCYWRSTWESHRFDDRKHAGEDTDFLHRVGHRRVKSVSSLDAPCGVSWDASGRPHDPRMIATVHGANTQQKTYDGFFKGGTVEMKRCAEWDERLRITLEGA